MGKHSAPSEEECLTCGHEHEDGTCYYCGIAADPATAFSPCTVNLGKPDLE